MSTGKIITVLRIRKYGPGKAGRRWWHVPGNDRQIWSCEAGLSIEAAKKNADAVEVSFDHLVGEDVHNGP